MPKKKKPIFIRWFNQLTNKDVALVGGKTASLGEMYCNLIKKGVNIPNGFAVTAQAYFYLLKEAKIQKEIRKILKDLNTHDIRNLKERGKAVRAAIMQAEIPKNLEKAIFKNYKKLEEQYGKNVDVAVRSSATAEDLPDASFAGQQETYLNIRGEKALIEACKKCFASLFTDRAISYREDKNFSHFKVGLSIAVQKMVRSDKAASGVMFSIDTESGFKDVVLINSSYGLGENIVQGKVNPDEFYVHKPTLLQGYKSIISKKLGAKGLRMIYSTGKSSTKDVPVPKSEQVKFSITDQEILQLARWALIIEEHYSKKAGHFKPMDMEWAKDGISGQLAITQARPETVQSQKDASVLEDYQLKKKGEVLVKGAPVGEKIGTGRVKMIKNVKDIFKFNKGEVLVTDMTDPDWEPIMKIAAAIVTNKGGRTCFSGESKILTNQGFLRLDQITKKKINEGISTVSLNRDSLKLEWKKISDSMIRRSETMPVSFSQTGRHRNNLLSVTPDHKFITLNNRTLVDTEISKIIQNGGYALVADKIPAFQNSNISKELAYLWGCIYTDGSIYLSRTHGEVQFIQKPTKEKEVLIRTVNGYFLKLFDKRLGVSNKQETPGQTIRGKKVVGSATAYRCYSKEIAAKFKKWQSELPANMLNCSREVNYHFLAGVIDGDGAFNRKSNRINIFCSNDVLLQAIIVSCLKLGILPQVTNNRSIHNVQIVDKIEELLGFTKRVKGKSQRVTNGTKFLSAKQLFYDVADLVNLKGKIKPYINGNLLIDKEKIEKNILPLLRGNIKKILEGLLNADFVSLRAVAAGRRVNKKVYNISVEDNHNYLVFTSKYTPVIVNNCHAAIVSRELGIPCIVGTEEATKKLKTGMDVTVCCAGSEEGIVYRGILPFGVKKVNIKNLKRPKTQIKMIIGTPELAFSSADIPNDGVGLAREEFIIASSIQIHPMALINYSRLKDKAAKAKIDKLTAGYTNKKQYYVDKLAYGIGTICAAFYPKEVIVRLADFKSNEYANLIGGRAFEPEEENPMIGLRGASRYYDDSYKAAFDLECKALVKVREEMGMINMKLMIPFCRTVEEAQQVKKILAEHGLKQGQDGLEIYVMCEIPSNVVLAEQFADEFDGFSIGSNDLTQLTLGLDRDSSLISHVGNERNEAVKRLVAQAIKTAKEKKKKIGICGQAPSDFPDFARYLVSLGIDSISLNPDTVMKTTIDVASFEKKKKKSLEKRQGSQKREK